LYDNADFSECVLKVEGMKNGVGNAEDIKFDYELRVGSVEPVRVSMVSGENCMMHCWLTSAHTYSPTIRE
jgi:hypothetical protein